MLNFFDVGWKSHAGGDEKHNINFHRPKDAPEPDLSVFLFSESL
jgi:hypothetical protein